MVQVFILQILMGGPPINLTPKTPLPDLLLSQVVLAR